MRVLGSRGLKSESEMEEELEEALKVFDKEGDGYILASEFKEVRIQVYILCSNDFIRVYHNKGNMYCAVSGPWNPQSVYTPPATYMFILSQIRLHLHCNYCAKTSFTCPPLSLARHSFVHQSELRQCGVNETAVGLLDWQSGASTAEPPHPYLVLLLQSLSYCPPLAGSTDSRRTGRQGRPGGIAQDS